MGGGRKPKFLANIVIKPPRISPIFPTNTGAAVNTGGWGSDAQLDCQTFDLEKIKVAVQKVKISMPVHGSINRGEIEVLHKELGTLGFAPPRVAKLIIRAGRNRIWAGEIIGVDLDSGSIEVTLCPT